MKTIALKEKTFQMLEDLKRKRKASSFDELIIKLVIEPNIPQSMFGSLKGKTKSFTRKEKEDMWGEE